MSEKKFPGEVWRTETFAFQRNETVTGITKFDPGYEWSEVAHEAAIMADTERVRAEKAEKERDANLQALQRGRGDGQEERSMSMSIELRGYRDGEDITDDDAGRQLARWPSRHPNAHGVDEHNAEMEHGFAIHLDALPDGIRRLRFVVSF